MKIYLFDSENGLYEGVTYEDPARLQNRVDVTPIPPPAYEAGQTLIFDLQKEEWVVMPTTIVRQLLHGSREKNAASRS